MNFNDFLFAVKVISGVGRVHQDYINNLDEKYRCLTAIRESVKPEQIIALPVSGEVEAFPWTCRQLPG